MDDKTLVERLRDRGVCSIAQNSCRNDYICEEAATRIEALEAELGNEKAHYETAQANWDLCLDRIEALETHNSDAYIIVIDLAASLAAAISLLEKGGKAAKKAAPSDKMFDQMLRDYRESLDRARQALAGDDHG